MFYTTFFLDWISVRSSNLRAVAYDRESAILYIEFRGGKVYRYEAVPPATVRDLLNASSKGRYFRYHIRYVFRCERC